MEDWTKRSDEKVFGGADEQPGSQASYWRDIEIKRRLHLLQREALQAQLSAIQAQNEATAAQKEAIEEMRAQSRIMFWSVVGIFATAVVTLLSALIS